MNSTAKGLMGKALFTEWFTQCKKLHPWLLDFKRPKDFKGFCRGLASGEIEIACIETDSTDGLKIVHWLLAAVGRAEKAEPSSEITSYRLYRPGYEIYSQPGIGNFIFVNPDWQPDLFSDDGLKRYAAELALKCEVPVELPRLA